MNGECVSPEHSGIKLSLYDQLPEADVMMRFIKLKVFAKFIFYTFTHLVGSYACFSIDTMYKAPPI